MPQFPIIPFSMEAEGEAPLQITCRTVTVSHAMHGHDYYELELIVDGSGTQWVNNERVPFGRGSLFLMTPDDYHRVEVNEPLRLYSIHFLPQTAQWMMHQPSEGARVSRLSEDKMRDFQKLLDHIVTREPDDYHAQELLAVTSLLICELMRNGAHYLLSKPGRQFQRALTYIRQHFTDPELRLTHVAQACGLSDCYFSTLFHRNVGCRFAEYVTDCRLRYACGLLRETDQSITEVSMEAGFASMSHFFRCFKNELGMTPGEYRGT